MIAIDADRAFGKLRARRRRNRIASVDWFDAFYAAYLTAIVVAVVIAVVARVAGGDQATADAVATTLERGPAVLGALLALGLVLGVRSGTRGGPLNFEAPIVHYVLLGPVSRAAAVGHAARRFIGRACFVGASVGGAAGAFAARRLPGSAAAWVASGALVGAASLTAVAAIGLVASGSRWPRWAAAPIAVTFLGWSVVDFNNSAATSPVDLIGRAALWPLDPHFGAAGAVAFIGVIALVATKVAAGLSIEAADKRSSLVSQLRFAATLRDVRTVVLLRRRLSDEEARLTPWFGKPMRAPTRLPVLRRDLRGLARWPLSRIARVLGLSVAAVALIHALWHGFNVAFSAAGVVLWIAALEAAEGLSQEVDHPDRFATAPMRDATLIVRHLAGAALGLAFFIAIAAATSIAVAPDRAAIVVAVALVLPATAACGAAVSIVKGPPPAPTLQDMMFPESAGARMVANALMGPLIAATALAPVALARPTHGSTPVGGVGLIALNLAIGALVLGGTTLWLRWHFRPNRLSIALPWSFGRLGAR